MTSTKKIDDDLNEVLKKIKETCQKSVEQEEQNFEKNGCNYRYNDGMMIGKALLARQVLEIINYRLDT